MASIISKHKGLIGWGSAAIATLAALTWGSRLSSIAKNIVIITRSNFDRAKLIYLIEVTIKNPVSQSIRIKQPFAVLRYKDAVIASSEPSSQIIGIPADGSSQTNIKISFDRDKVFANAPSVIMTLLSGGKIPVTATIYSGLVTSFGTTEIKKDESWQLGT